MLLKCIGLLRALQIVSCLSLANDFNSNGKLSMNQRKCPFNPDFVGLVPVLPGTNIAGTDIDKTTSIYENYFPDVIYPTCILDIAEPFYYLANGYDEVLGPFDEDVKSAYKSITSNNKKTKVNNLQRNFEVEKGKCIPITTSSQSDKNNNTHEQNKQKQLIYEVSKEDCSCPLEYDSISSEETISSNEQNETEIYEDDDLSDISQISLNTFNNNGSQINSCFESNPSLSDSKDCNIIASTEYKVTSNVSNSNASDEIIDTKNYSLLQKTISDDRHVRIKIKINIEVSKVPGQHNVTVTTENLNMLPNEILEYIASGENETCYSEGEQFTYKNCSAEEMSIDPEDILKLLLNSSSHADLVLTELLTEILSLESSEESENVYSLLELLKENYLDITKVQLPINGTGFNTPDNHEYLETFRIHVQNNSFDIRDDNRTSENQSEDVEDDEETGDGDFFLDFVISLDTQCQMNDTILSDNLNEAKQKCITVYSDDSSSEED